jgi:hypothetical protein
MSKVKMLKLGVNIKSLIGGDEGHLTTFMVMEDKSVRYIFQPNAIIDNKLAPNRCAMETEFDLKQVEVLSVELPIEILGTVATDKFSKMTGVITQICVYMNGCIHIWLQPNGITKEGQLIDAANFSILDVEGPKITEKTIHSINTEKKLRPKKVKSFKESSPVLGQKYHL